jgi:integrase
MDSRDRAIITLLAKTGIRRGELITLDISDVNWENYSIILKPMP